MMRKILPWLFIYLFFSFSFFFFSCRKGNNEVKYILEEGFTSLENSFFENAENKFKEVLKLDKENCEARWGLTLVNINKVIQYLNSIITLISGITSSGISLNLSPIDVKVRSDMEFFYTKSLITKSLNEILDAIFTPFFEPLREVSENAQKVYGKCSRYAVLPIILSSRETTYLKLYFRGVWGDAESSALIFLSEFINAILKLILSINFDINIQKLLEIGSVIGSQIGLPANPTPQDIVVKTLSAGAQFISSYISLNVYDTIGFFSSLAYIIDTSPNLLRLRTGGETFIDEVAQSLSKSLLYLSNFFNSMVKQTDKNIVAYMDIEKDGFSPDDEIFLNIYDTQGRKGIFVNIGGNEVKIDALLTNYFLKPLLYENTRIKIIKFLSEWSQAFNLQKNLPDEKRWIHISDLQNLTLSIIQIPDVIIFNPKNLFEGLKKDPEGFRRFLPIWTDINGDGIPDFIIEAERRTPKFPYCIDKKARSFNFILNPTIKFYKPQEEKVGTTEIRMISGNINLDILCSISADFNIKDKYNLIIDSETKIRNFTLNMKEILLPFKTYDCNICYSDELYEICWQDGNICQTPDNQICQVETIADDQPPKAKCSGLECKIRGYRLCSDGEDVLVKYYRNLSILKNMLSPDVWGIYRDYIEKELFSFSCEKYPNQSCLENEKIKIVESKPITSRELNLTIREEFDEKSCLIKENVLYIMYPITYEEGEFKIFSPPIPMLSTSPLGFAESARAVATQILHQKGLYKGEVGERVIGINELSRVFKLEDKYIVFYTLGNNNMDDPQKSSPKNFVYILGCIYTIPRCFMKDDSEHFPEYVIHQGLRIRTRTEKDCIAPEETWSYYYIAFRDPTFLGSIKVNIENTGIICKGDESEENNGKGWLIPTQYSINKVISFIVSKTLSPLISTLASLGRLIGISGSNIAVGNSCIEQ